MARPRWCDTRRRKSEPTGNTNFGLNRREAARFQSQSQSGSEEVAAEAEAVSVTCTNPYSGATWRITIDYDLKTVDANPASIDETQIWWRDGKDGWRYTLDRKSGALTVVLASATGGNFLFDQCRMP